MATKIISLISICVGAIITWNHFLYEGLLYLYSSFVDFSFSFLLIGIVKIFLSPIVFAIVMFGILIVLSCVYGIIKGIGELIDN